MTSFPIEKYINKVYTELGNGFKEVVYQNALAIELRKNNHHVQKEINHSVFYEGEEIGTIRIDLLVDKNIIIEMKTITKITEKEINQLKRYLKLFESDGITEGYLINVNNGYCITHVKT